MPTRRPQRVAMIPSAIGITTVRSAVTADVTGAMIVASNIGTAN